MSRSSPSVVLGDELGPRGRRRVWIATAVATVVLVWVGSRAIQRLADFDQLDWELWEPLTRWTVIKYLLTGLRNTLTSALVAMVLSFVLGWVLALLRLARTAPLRWLSATFVEFFRGVPLILLVFFAFSGLRTYDIDLSPYQALVLALTVYNGAVLGEVFRAGIRSLDSGQTEASLSLGLGYWPTMLFVVLPQALRRMVPAIVSQLVTLLKDSSLGFIIAFDELLQRGRTTGEFFRNQLQTMTVVALLYILVNLALSRIARRLELRQRRRLGAGAIVVTGLEDLGAMSTVGTAAVTRGPIDDA